MILYRRSTMLARKQPKEKDAVDRMLDQIDFHGMAKDEILGEDGLLKTFTSRLLSRALEAEMDSHLGYEKNDNAGDNSGNSRNGYTEKTVINDGDEKVDVQVYGVDVSPELISNVTESVMADVREWQTRPLEKSYPILFLDALRINSHAWTDLQDSPTQ